jgi:hypothetical protein
MADQLAHESDDGSDAELGLFRSASQFDGKTIPENEELINPVIPESFEPIDLNHEEAVANLEDAGLTKRIRIARDELRAIEAARDQLPSLTILKHHCSLSQTGLSHLSRGLGEVAASLRNASSCVYALRATAGVRAEAAAADLDAVVRQVDDLVKTLTLTRRDIETAIDGYAAHAAASSRDWRNRGDAAGVKP